MDITQAMDAIASSYGVQKTVNRTFVDSYPAAMSLICMRRGVTLCDRCFTSMFGGVPAGYQREEVFFYKEFSSIFNDSYNSSFVDYAYDVVEPRLKQKYRGIPVFFENLFGKTCMCVMLNINAFVTYGSVNRLSIDRCVNEFDEMFKVADRMINSFYD